ncbi:MAG: DUF2098 family protein [Methanobacteriaceae archaeon]|nr:DUF2098 family protein [Methanobacteriaceae archaeon]
MSEVVDMHGKNIDVGTYVTYTKTGTNGEVLDTKIDDNGSWALMNRGELDKLWYNTQYLEVTINAKRKSQNTDKKLSTEELEEKIKNKYADVGMSEDACGGG